MRVRHLLSAAALCGAATLALATGAHALNTQLAEAPAPPAAQDEPAPPPAAKECVRDDSGFKSDGDQPTYVIALENSCAVRLRCTVDVYILGARGPTQGRATLVLGPGSEGQATRTSHALKVKSAGGMAQSSRKCRQI